MVGVRHYRPHVSEPFRGGADLPSGEWLITLQPMGEEEAGKSKVTGHVVNHTGVPLAAGENACTVWEFQKMFEAGAVTFGQPSVTKVGGITEFRKIAVLAEIQNVTLMPHSPYFGPGFLATLQLSSALPAESLLERFYVKPEASLYGDFIDPVDGFFRMPDGPGLGLDPDPEVVKAYRRQEE